MTGQNLPIFFIRTGSSPLPSISGHIGFRKTMYSRGSGLGLDFELVGADQGQGQVLGLGLGSGLELARDRSTNLNNQNNTDFLLFSDLSSFCSFLRDYVHCYQEIPFQCDKDPFGTLTLRHHYMFHDAFLKRFPAGGRSGFLKYLLPWLYKQRGKLSIELFKKVQFFCNLAKTLVLM